MGRVHQRAGEIMATHWELPEDIRFAIWSHHQVMIQGHAHPLAATVAIANELTHDLGVGGGVIPKVGQDLDEMTEGEADCVRAHTSVDRSSEKTLEHARTALGLIDATMELIREEAAATLAALASDGE